MIWAASLRFRFWTSWLKLRTSLLILFRFLREWIFNVTATLLIIILLWIVEILFHSVIVILVLISFWFACSWRWLAAWLLTTYLWTFQLSSRCIALIIRLLFLRWSLNSFDVWLALKLRWFFPIIFLVVVFIIIFFVLLTLFLVV